MDVGSRDTIKSESYPDSDSQHQYGSGHEKIYKHCLETKSAK